MKPKELPETVKTGDVLKAVQLCPFGEWPNGGTAQKCDEAAFHNLVDSWRRAGARGLYPETRLHRPGPSQKRHPDPLFLHAEARHESVGLFALARKACHPERRA